MNFFDIAIFSSGIVLGVYLDQIYRLPNVQRITNDIVGYLKRYEPRKKKEKMDVDNKIL